MRINLPVTQQNFDYPGDELLVSSTNTKGEITHCNPAFVRVSGYSYDELIGQPHNIIRHPDMPPEAYKDMWRTIGRGEPWTGLVKNRRKNGDHRDLHVRSRRQRQMCIRDSVLGGVPPSACAVHGVASGGRIRVCLLYTSPSPRDS